MRIDKSATASAIGLVISQSFADRTNLKFAAGSLNGASRPAPQQLLRQKMP
jgi:hypothetical protein